MKKIFVTDLKDEFNFKFGEGLKLHFNNGDIIVPSDYGAYAICPGCGSGKTTIAKELIRIKWNEGILYSAFTKDECNQMYDYCISLVGSKTLDLNGNLIELKPEDIAVVHSDYSAAGTDRDTWINNTSQLANKRIVICTHAKLSMEPLHLLVRANFNRFIGMEDPTKECMSATGNLYPRQWILIDEMPEVKRCTKSITKTSLVASGVCTCTPSYECYKSVKDDADNTFIKVFKGFDMMLNDNRYISFKEKLGMISCMSKEIRDLLPNDNDNLITKYRKDSIIDMLFRDFNKLSSVPGDMVNVSHKFTDMIVDGMKSHVLLLDGTSDVTLYNSSKFKLLTFNDKYNSNISINTIPFNLDRRIRPIKGVDDLDYYIKYNLSIVIDNLYDIISKNNKTLIFTWMNFKSNGEEINDESSIDDSTDNSIIVKKLSGIVSNPDVNLPEYIKFELYRRGVDQNKFSIEYYGSGKDKAVNDYKDYDSVVLLGRYQVPNKVFEEFNDVYGTEINGVAYYTNRVIQAICRTRIRMHKKLPINVYFSSDWNEQIISLVISYLNNGEINSRTSIDKNDLKKIMMTTLREFGVTPERSDRIAELSIMYDNQIYYSIINRSPYSFDIKLDDIFSIIPMSAKKISKYNAISNWLKKYGIFMNVI